MQYSTVRKFEVFGWSIIEITQRHLEIKAESQSDLLFELRLFVDYALCASVEIKSEVRIDRASGYSHIQNLPTAQLHMNRWETYQYSPPNTLQQVAARDAAFFGVEAFQHGTIGNFLGSNIEGVMQKPVVVKEVAVRRIFFGIFYTNLCNGNLFCDLNPLFQTLLKASLQSECKSFYVLSDEHTAENGICMHSSNIINRLMAGVFVLLGFVLLVFIVGACIVIFCYWRTKNEQRYKAREYSSYGSQIGMHPDSCYNSYTNPVMLQSGGHISWMGFGEENLLDAENPSVGHGLLSIPLAVKYYKINFLPIEKICRQVKTPVFLFTTCKKDVKELGINSSPSWNYLLVRLNGFVDSLFLGLFRINVDGGFESLAYTRTN
ncbi:unnamed protein product [Gongylonema pulchrum]|uniref:Peptidase A1 domain-containing protein n=1 Tax=Gongylonema pulchrum TaxID=637853 RepID=A0A183E2G7_9BILA|nr:unnamed protein product [Gongylonema pulchrum]